MTNKMWGGRFNSGPDELMQQINASIGFDQRLFSQDIAGSIAHATMLGECGIIAKSDVRDIVRGLKAIRKDIEAGEFSFSAALEDIHMNVEAALKDRIGGAAGRLHTARSRNDQIATDFKLYVRDCLDMFDEQLQELQRALANKALAHADAVMPGFTHLQSAQPVTFGHHLLAYVEMIARDRSRFADARKRMNESPLGAAAPTRNSLDSVADRDFVLETLAAASICAMHLSRFAEELVIWSTPQFGFVRLSDRFTTGSSIMPQKKNPDAAELIRAKPGRILGAFASLLVVMKGLPLAYSKDMQEDKEPAFDALDALSLAIAAMTGMATDMEPVTDKLAAAAGAGYSTATDLADWLVRVLEMPFRDAHHVTGTLVAIAEKRGVGLDELSLEEMQGVEQRITGDVYKVRTPQASAASRQSFGGTAPANVRREARRWLKSLG